jgi:hypothetical protein
MKIRQVQVVAEATLPSTDDDKGVESRSVQVRLIADLDEGDSAQDAAQQLQAEAEAAVGRHIEHVQASAVMGQAALGAAQTLTDYEAVVSSGALADAKPEMLLQLKKASRGLVRTLTTSEIAKAYGLGTISHATYMNLLEVKRDEAAGRGDRADLAAIANVMQQAEEEMRRQGIEEPLTVAAGHDPSDPLKGMKW